MNETRKPYDNVLSGLLKTLSYDGNFYYILFQGSGQPHCGIFPGSTRLQIHPTETGKGHSNRKTNGFQ